MPISEREFAELSRDFAQLEREVVALRLWRATQEGVAREAAQSIARLFAIGGLALTLLNVSVTLYLR